MTQVAIDYDKLHEAVMVATETLSVTPSRPVVFLPRDLWDVITQAGAAPKMRRCLEDYYGYLIGAFPVGAVPPVGSAESAEKVHAHLPWGDFTLCGRGLGTVGIYPLGMEWFTRDELSRVDPDRPCKTCRDIVVAQGWQR